MRTVLPSIPWRATLRHSRLGRECRRGFTMMEVLLAALIFAILGAMILATFRTGTRAYERAERESQIVDRARFVFDTLERDILSVYFRLETDYNITMRAKINELDRDLQQAMDLGDEDRLRRYTDEDTPGYVGNPYEYGMLLDLQMVGEPKSDDARLTFAAYHPVVPGRPSTLWGLSRLTYESSGGVLVRTVDNVMDSSVRDIYGELIEPPEPPLREILAHGVKRFQLRYGYWFDEVWLESDHWNSNDKDIRSSFNILSPEEYEDTENWDEQETAESRRRQQLREQAPQDALPSYVRVLLDLADPKSPKHVRRFQTLIRFPIALETFVPNPELEPERRDEEIDLRRERSYESRGFKQ